MSSWLSRRLFASRLLGGAGAGVFAGAAAAAVPSVRAECSQIEELSHRVAIIEDTNAIRALHFKYGYYMDTAMFDEIVELFADDCEIHFLGGVYRGRAGAQRLYQQRLGRTAGDRPGRLFDHLMLQDIVDVSPDRSTAHGRFRNFMQRGLHRSRVAEGTEPPQSWQSGIYENTYSRRDGIWRIAKFDYHIVWEAPVNGGWAMADPSEREAEIFSRTYPEDPTGPDELEASRPRFWPEPIVVPFHYPNPVTGR